MGWRKRPKFAQYFPEDIDYVIFIDESGDTSYKNVRKCIKKGIEAEKANRFFTISGCIINRKEFPKIRKETIELKEKYWKDGLHKYKNKELKRVCFHSTEIRNNKEAFSKDLINFNDFMIDLSDFMAAINIKILSATLDKDNMVRRYTSPVHPYTICLEFILERFVKYFARENEKCLIILESRGKKEDKFILDFLTNFIDNGGQYTTPNECKKIKGVYFNPKWCSESNKLKSYFGLEITDLVNFPIHKFSRGDGKDKAFECIENKIYGFPNYNGKGVKIYPKK